MKNNSLMIALAVVSIVALAGNSTTVAQGTCGDSSQAHRLVIIVNSEIPVEVRRGNKNADDLYVCAGDTVEWQLVGSAGKFFVDFVGGAPFDGSAKKNSSNNGKIQITIAHSAVPGAAYKYDIGIVGGGLLDPRIIIDR
jgi:hypothetical protein